MPDRLHSAHSCQLLDCNELFICKNGKVGLRQPLLFISSDGIDHLIITLRSSAACQSNSNDKVLAPFVYW